MYQSEYLKFCDALTDINIIVEVGARDGNDSIALSKRYPLAKIFAFECNPDTISECKKNLSDYKNITFVDKALGERETLTQFYSYNSSNPGASSFFKRIDYENTQHVSDRIQMIAFDSFAKTHAIEKVDLLCMDVQGYEINVLKGFGEFLKNVRYIIMEVPKDKINETYLPKGIYTKYLGAPNPSEIKEFMEKNNFQEIKRIEENKIEDNVLFERI